MPEPHLRAADADRAAVAATLGEHMAAGRLTLAEYDERVARAYAAKTYGELDELTLDLPHSSARGRTTRPASTALPAPAHGSTPAPTCGTPGSLEQGWRAWFATGVTVIAIWLITSLASGEFLYFWPVWVIGPWGAALLLASIGRAGQRPRGPGSGVDRTGTGG
jgi:hypothetical protein